MATITIEARGESFGAYLALPAKTPAPAMVVAQEIFGINAVMRAACNWLAGAGYVACCPDLFWRIEPGIEITDQTEAEWKRAFELFNAFDVDKGVDDLKTTLAHLRAHDACQGKVGTIGYCLGGKLAYLMAARSKTDCTVGYYGVGLDALLGEAAAITRPLMLHMASEDEFAPPEVQAKVKAGLAGHGQVTLHLYQGQDHAFARPGGEHYDQAAADLANGRTLDFLKEHLS